MNNGNRFLGFFSSAALLTTLVLSGCGASPSAGSGGSGTGGTGGGGSTTPTSPSASTIYVISAPLFGSGPFSLLEFAATDNGAVSPTATIAFPANFDAESVVSDSTGQVYVAGIVPTATEVLVYSAGATGAATPTRTITVAQANGAPTSLALDSSGSLYLMDTNFASISVFAPNASGTATPTRVISGSATQILASHLWDMTVDNSGNIYVATESPSLTGGDILVFGASANGNVSPTNTITSYGKYFTGVAVDKSGDIFATESTYSHDAVLVEFPATASGAATPTKTITPTPITGFDLYLACPRVDTNGYVYAFELATQGTTLGAPSLVSFAPSLTGTTTPTTQSTSTLLVNTPSSLSIR